MAYAFKYPPPITGRYLRAKMKSQPQRAFSPSLSSSCGHAQSTNKILQFRVYAKPLRCVPVTSFRKQLMAAARSPVTPHVIGSALFELSRTPSHIGAPFSVRISSRSHCISSSAATYVNRQPPEGPSCVFVGPIESASQETLEALYRQARDAYYSGKPLILDDMFDKVELKLRWYGSKYVVKYPRCSLRRQSTYADAEEDPSQVFALASIWFLILGFGSSACLVPMLYTICRAYQDAIDSGVLHDSQASVLEFLTTLNGTLLILFGFMIGYPIASASVGALQRLWNSNLVALKGACPNCGEEVFAFVRSDQSNSSPHRSECHVCESSLEFRTKMEKSISRPGNRWVYGRIYLIEQRGQRQRWA